MEKEYSLAEQLQWKVKDRVVIRIHLDMSGSTISDCADIQLLAKYSWWPKSIRHLRYRGVCHHTSLTGESPNWTLSMESYEDTPEAWARIVADLEEIDRSHRWTWANPAEYYGAVDFRTNSAPVAVPGYHPRILQELSRLQTLLEDKIRTSYEARSDDWRGSIELYRRLGHFIEQRNRKVWDVLFNGD